MRHYRHKEIREKLREIVINTESVINNMYDKCENMLLVIKCHIGSNH